MLPLCMITHYYHIPLYHSARLLSLITSHCISLLYISLLSLITKIYYISHYYHSEKSHSSCSISLLPWRPSAPQQGPQVCPPRLSAFQLPSVQQLHWGSCLRSIAKHCEAKQTQQWKWSVKTVDVRSLGVFYDPVNISRYSCRLFQLNFFSVAD